ncbi:hypothetical protein JXA59_02530 [Patescibacteria group bacterium]|nr:hypothetical protein [Patescibacteria group bacterium]
MEAGIKKLMSDHLPKTWELTMKTQSELRCHVGHSLAERMVMDHSFPSEEVAAFFHHARQHSEVFFVSLDPTICCQDELPQISITRICDIHGDDIDHEHGPRPKFPPIEKQVKQLAEQANGRRIVLVDDGYWEGSTVRKIGNFFADSGVSVESAIVVFHFNDGKPTAVPLIVHPDNVIPKSENQDWVCMRDLVPGWPLSGRTVIEPIDGIWRGLSYLEDKGRNRGSLDELDPEKFQRLRLGLLDVSIQLFELVEDTLGHPVTVKMMERIPLGFSAQPNDRFINLIRQWQYSLTEIASLA